MTISNPLTGSPLAVVDDAGSVLGSVNDAPEAAEEENDVEAVMGLRKNLMVSFEKAPSSKASGAAPIHPGSRPPMMPHHNRSCTGNKLANGEVRGLKRSSSSASIDSNISVDSISNEPTTKIPAPGHLMSVYLRIRPLPSKIVPGTEPNTMEVVEETEASFGRRVRTFPPSNSQAYKAIRQSSDVGGNRNAVVTSGVKEFQFDRVFNQKSNQKEIYQNVAYPLVKGLLGGDSALLFSFGNTNAGKTYTVMGEIRSREDRKCGIIPRALRDIIDGSALRKGCDVHISFFEIYNDSVIDLLVSEDETAKDSRKRSFVIDPPSLKVREGKDGQIFVQGLSKHKITSVSQGVKLATMGKGRSQTASNNINGESSRSHCIFQIELSTRKVVSDKMETATMWIVDLAGSERSKRTGNVTRSKRAREAATINASLMNLMQCIRQLSDNQSRGGSNVGVVPFRSSKLSHLFMNHLTSSSAERTAMIVNVNPTSEDFDETQHVLSYASVARNVKVNAKEYQKRIKVTKVVPVKVDCEAENEKKRAQKRPHNSKKVRSPRKVAKLINKLSPRAFRPKTRAAEKRAVSQASSTTSSVTGASKAPIAKAKVLQKKIDPKAKKEKSKSKPARDEDELEKMREAVEEEVREEVAEEFEERVTQIREQYEERLAKASSSNGSPDKFLERSAKKLQRDRQEQYIDELQDTIEECEEEMDRMREAGEAKIQDILAKHAEELAMANKEIEELRKLQFGQSQALEAKDHAIAKLEDELEPDDDIMTSHDTNEDSEASEDSNDTSLDEEQEGGDQDSLICSEEDASEDGQQDRQKQETKQDRCNQENSAPRVKKLRHGRASEVACELSNTPPKSSAKKMYGKSSEKKGRTPLTNISKASENAACSDGEEEEGMSLRARLRSKINA